VIVEDVAPTPTPTPAPAAGESYVSANELPDGFAVEAPPAGIDQASGDEQLSNSDFASPPPGPGFTP
jgi:hypothetical protein